MREITELSGGYKRGACGCELTEIGVEISEQLDVIPAKIHVKQYVRKKYACRSCEESIETAHATPKIVPKSNATSRTLTYINTAKHQDELPEYRLSNIL